MTAFCEIFDWTESLIEINELTRTMLATIPHRGNEVARHFFDDQKRISIAAAFRLSEIENDAPTNWCERSDYVCVLDGSIYNYQSLLSKYRDSGTNGAEAVIAVRQNSPTSFPLELDGIFALALWEKQAGTLWLVRDPLGRKPLYYSILPSGSFIFASEPKALVVKGAR